MTDLGISPEGAGRSLYAMASDTESEGLLEGGRDGMSVARSCPLSLKGIGGVTDPESGTSSSNSPLASASLSQDAIKSLLSRMVLGVRPRPWSSCIASSHDEGSWSESSKIAVTDVLPRRPA